MSSSLSRQSKYIFYEIAQTLSLKDTLKLGGVCKKIQNVVHFKNAKGLYPLLIKEDINDFADRLESLFGCSILLNICLKEYPQPKTVKILIKAGADVNMFDIHYHYNPLIRASERGHLKMVEILLKNGADVNVVDCDGNSALYEASCRGHPEIVKLLLEFGARIDQQCIYGNNHTALMSASEGPTSNALDVVKLLLEKGANTEIRAKGGETALHLACGCGNTDIIKELLKFNAKINSQSGGWTPLMKACYFGSPNPVELLLENGADPKIKNFGNDDSLAIDFVQGKYKEKIIEIFGKYE